MAIYLGTATPSAFNIGTAPVSGMYLGTTQVFTTGGGGGGGGWTSKSTNWTAVGFSGTGLSSTDKFFKAAVGDSAFDAAYATVPGAGTVKVTSTSFDCGNAFIIYKNGVAAYTYPEDSAGDGITGGVIPATGTNSCSISVLSGAVIRFGSSGDHTAFQNLYIWWETA